MSATADDWTPEFDGQRPPFAPGNEAAVMHGARSASVRGPARRPGSPRNSSRTRTRPITSGSRVFAAACAAWARARPCAACCGHGWRAGTSWPGLPPSATTTEDEICGKGKTNRKSVTRTPLGAGPAAPVREHRVVLRSKLGLDPASAARVGRDLALTRHMNAGATPLDEALGQRSSGAGR